VVFREQRLEIERKKREADALKECSFAPAIKTGNNQNRSGSAGRVRPATSSSSNAKSTKSVSATSLLDLRQDGPWGSSQDNSTNQYFEASGFQNNSKKWRGDVDGEVDQRGPDYAVDDWGLEDTAPAGGKIKVSMNKAVIRPRQDINAGNKLAAEEAMLTKRYAAAASKLKSGNGTGNRLDHQADYTYPLSAADLTDLLDDHNAQRPSGTTETGVSGRNLPRPSGPNGNSAHVLATHDYMADYSHTFRKSAHSEDDESWDDPRIVDSPGWEIGVQYPPPPSSPPPTDSDTPLYSPGNFNNSMYNFVDSPTSPPPPPSIPPTPPVRYINRTAVGSHSYPNERDLRF
jgi:hypothetical protein